jgi:hypothetical protein
MNDDIGLEEDLEPSEEATEDVKGGAATLSANSPAASLAAADPTKSGVGGAAGNPITKLA